MKGLVSALKPLFQTPVEKGFFYVVSHAILPAAAMAANE
jgi:hypothetical protein